MSKANKEYCPMCASELESWDYKLHSDRDWETRAQVRFWCKEISQSAPLL